MSIETKLDPREERRKAAVIAARTDDLAFLRSYLSGEGERGRLNYKVNSCSLLGEAVKWNALKSAAFLMQRGIRLWMEPISENPLSLSIDSSPRMLKLVSQYYLDQFNDDKLDIRVIDGHVEHALVRCLPYDNYGALMHFVRIGLHDPWAQPTPLRVGGQARPYLWHLAARYNAIFVLAVLRSYFSPVYGIGARPDEVIDKRGWTALHYTCHHTSGEAAFILLQQWSGAATSRTYDGIEPLHLAVTKGCHPVIIEELRNRGGRTDVTNQNGQNAFHRASQLHRGERAIQALCKPTLEEKNVFQTFASIGMTHKLCPDVMHKICEMARVIPKGINAVDSDGLTPLAHSCTTMGGETMIALLECKAAPQHRMDSGQVGVGRNMIPLYNLSVWKLLTKMEGEEGTSPHVKENRMKLEQYITCTHCSYSRGCKSLYEACRRGHLSCASRQIRLGDVSNDLRQRKWNSREYVAARKYPRIRALLERSCGPRGPLVRTFVSRRFEPEEEE